MSAVKEWFNARGIDGPIGDVDVFGGTCGWAAFFGDGRMIALTVSEASALASAMDKDDTEATR